MPMEPWLDRFARANFLRSADTAHDLKTPLNVAVLNLELLRMRLRKVAGDEDEKIAGYTRAIEVELRRLGSIFDAFFLLSTPPKNDELPSPVDVAAISAEAAASAGVSFNADGSAAIEAHEARIRQAAQLFFRSATKLLLPEGLSARASRNEQSWTLAITGKPRAEDFEATRIFKFYYTDAEGSPDLSAAVARLIVETYGGELNAVEEHDKVTLRLSFPLGAR
jgi:signal transduction histidine kinase